MSSMKLMPTTPGTHAFGTSIESWLTSDLTGAGCYQLPVQAPNHLQISDVVPATAAFSARPNAGVAVNGTDAARKRGRPPRGEPR